MTRQLEAWKGGFGKAYTDRNVVDWRSRLSYFHEMLDDLPVKDVLEIGCNRGHNLVALRELCDGTLIGIEPNQYALGLAKASGVNILQGNIFDLPLENECFDLVFTANVLSHITLEDLPTALAEVHRVSKHYILALEYYAKRETIIHYRGHDDLLWKRNFRGHYQSQFPDLELIRKGYWPAGSPFHRTHWWLFKKT